MEIDPHAGVTDLESLRRVIRERRQGLPMRRRQLADSVQAEVVVLTKEAANLEEAAAKLRVHGLQAQEVAAQQAERLKAQEGWFGIRWTNALRSLLVRRRAQRALAAAEAKATSVKSSAEDLRRRAEQLLKDPTVEVERRIAPEVRVIESLESLNGTPIARGAVGEHAVEAELRRLCNQYWVLHDVRLRAKSFLRFDGKPVQSAQIDHLIVGPTGVFVLETKSWSSSTVACGGHFDPFEQVGRAGLLTHVLLKDADLFDRVHNVIVSHQPVSASRNRRYTENVRPGQLLGFVRTRKAVLSEAEAETIASFFLGENQPK
ncbi:MAG: NERD domain-containing protein [Planctomycetes bacterium]|nr:NERD domain-containing protein [Planctomycetota bacterium]MCC7395495.1 NERD domain-containing protein [Planctomycetota bacterium]